MFNLNSSQNDKNPKKKNIKNDWFNFISNGQKDKILSSLTEENTIVQEEYRLRSMVVDMLNKEFGEEIRNIKGYDYLVESVINKLKNKQLELEPYIQEN